MAMKPIIETGWVVGNAETVNVWGGICVPIPQSPMCHIVPPNCNNPLNSCGGSGPQECAPVLFGTEPDEQ